VKEKLEYFSFLMLPDLHSSIIFGRSQGLFNMSVYWKQPLKLKMSMEYWWHDTGNGKSLHSYKKCTNVTLPATKLTWAGPGSHRTLHGVRSATLVTDLKNEIYIRNV